MCLLDLNGLIPVSVIVAVAIFAYKEITEYRRRKREYRNNLHLIQSLLGSEIELNWRYFHLNLKIFEVVENLTFTATLTQSRTGLDHYHVLIPKEQIGGEGNASYEGPLPKLQLNAYERANSVLCQLKPEMFDEIESLYKECSTVNRVRDAFAAKLANETVPMESMYTSYMVSQLVQEQAELDQKFRQAYKNLTGNTLQKGDHGSEL